MWAANGERLKVYGECTMSVEVAWTSFRVAVLIGYTPGNAFILGTDVMAELGFTIRVGPESVIIEKLETSVPMYQDRRHRCCRIQVAESISVPPGCEMLVTGTPKGNRWSKSETIGLVEGLGDFLRETGLMVARAVVDPKKGRIPVRVANMGPETVVLRPGTPMALMTPDVNVGEQPMERKIPEDEGDVVFPDHLEPLLMRGREVLRPDEIRALERVIVSFQYVFVGPDGKLGFNK